MGAQAHHHEESFVSKYVFSHDHKMISKQFLGYGHPDGDRRRYVVGLLPIAVGLAR